MRERPHCNRKKANVYSYARWSSDAQTDGDSLRRQTKLAQDWCAAKGYTLIDSQIDAGVSAWKGKNHAEGSGLDRLLARVQQGDILLVESSDRLSRESWFDHMLFLRKILAKGVTVVTMDNGNEITAERFERDPGCFLPAVMSAHRANSENELKSKRIKESWQARYDKLAKGQAANLRLPCWLRWDMRWEDLKGDDFHFLADIVSSDLRDLEKVINKFFFRMTELVKLQKGFVPVKWPDLRPVYDGGTLIFSASAIVVEPEIQHPPSGIQTLRPPSDSNIDT